MRKSLRLVLVALLTLALPLSVFADVSFAKRCVMKANGVVVAMDRDCCDPVKVANFTSKQQTCKTGQECNTPSSFPPAPAIVVCIAPTATPLVIGWQSPPLSSQHLDSLWRPPRSIS